MIIIFEQYTFILCQCHQKMNLIEIKSLLNHTHDRFLILNPKICRGLAGIKGVQPERKAFCAMEIEGQTNKVLCTNYVSQKNPVWTNKAEFQTKQPLPTVKVCLRIESNNPLYLEGRPIGEVRSYHVTF